jgi:hypothetical protein
VRIGKPKRPYAETGDESYAAHAALIRRVAGITGWKKAVREAVRLVFEARHQSANERGYDAPHAWDHLASVATNDREHLALMRITMYTAKQDIRFWVKDTSTHSYCCKCQCERPLQDFGSREWKCNRHE